MDQAQACDRLARGVLEVIAALFEARAVALIACEGESRRLVWSDCIDQADIEALAALGTKQRHALECGQGIVFERPRRQFVMPCLLEGALNGLVLLRPVPRLDQLAPGHFLALSTLLACGLDRLRAGPSAAGQKRDEARAQSEPQSVDERAQLQQLLDRQEWNISRAARVLGVTRAMMYDRLRGGSGSSGSG